jgi:hypothetical protein
MVGCFGHTDGSAAGEEQRQGAGGENAKKSHGVGSIKVEFLRIWFFFGAFLCGL